MNASVHAEIQDLRQQLERHNRLYYVEARTEISDFEYDQLLKRLEELEAAHPEFDSPDSPSHKVGGQPVADFQSVTHRVPMISIENVYKWREEDPKKYDVEKFDAFVRKELEAAQPEYTIEYKIDGVALALIYEHGRLTQAVTRGDGRVGDDVTHNARTVRGVPLRLETDSPPAYFEIRGEAFIANSDFAHIRADQERAGEQPFANPRNATAGALKSLDPKKCAQRKLRFFAHSVGFVDGLECRTHLQFLETVRQFGVPVTPRVKPLSDINLMLEYSQSLMDGLHELDFEVDGLVIKVNEFKQRDMLGATTKAPRWVIAYKWEKYEATTRIWKIDIQVGKTGALTPVAHLDPVEIAGTTVSRASLHNRKEIQRLGVRIGDWVVVKKAGKIIPHIVRVEEHRRSGAETEFHFPNHCPECGSAAIQDDGGVYVRCQNPSCPAQLRESLRYFASRSAMDIEGLGTKLIEQLTGSGDQLLPPAVQIESLPGIFRLKNLRADLVGLERMGEKSVDNLLAGIEAAKQRPLWRLLTGLNIRHVGQRTAQLLADRFGTIDLIMQQSEQALAEVDEVGPVIAKSVFAFFSSEVGRRTVEELRELGVHLGTPVAEKPASAQRLLGKTIVVTGALERFSRDAIKEFIHQQGGKPASSVSKKTDFVVAGADAGSKLEKAKELGIRVLTEAEFIALVEEPVTEVIEPSEALDPSTSAPDSTG